MVVVFCFTQHIVVSGFLLNDGKGSMPSHTISSGLIVTKRRPADIHWAALEQCTSSSQTHSCPIDR
jgi:hypothetical protein